MQEYVNLEGENLALRETALETCVLEAPHASE